MAMQPRRRDFIRGVAGALAGAAAMRRVHAAIDRRPNVLFVIADDQRSDTIAALGNQHISTPTIDKLVNGGCAFTRARNMGAQVAAVCIAARAMIHTGRSLFRAPQQPPKSIPTMAETFRAAGYHTFGCGKWHNGVSSFARGFADGGNIFFGGMNANQYRCRLHDFDPTGVYSGDSEKTAYKFSSELYADAAVEFLTGYKEAAPFFAYLAFTSPHDPRMPPGEFSTMYDPTSIPLPENFLPEHPFDNGDMRIRDEMLAPFPRTRADTQKQLADYYGMVSSQDLQLSRVLQALQNSGRADNTIIAYTGDHGLAIGSHGLFGKQNVYEHSVGVPLLFHGPGIPSGARFDPLVYGFDLFPTLCQLTGVAPPQNIEGHSLLDVMRGKTPRVRESTFHAYIRPSLKGSRPRVQHAVNDGRWKFIRYDVDGRQTRQLFDLQQDPFEIHNCVQDSVARSDLDRLEKQLTQFQQDLDEPAEWRNP
jgi:arylsulfatase A-like enzyme